MVALACYALWLRRISSSRPDWYRLLGWHRRLAASCAAAAAAAAGVPLLQLNARLAQQAVLPLDAGALAPHEWLGE